MTLIKFKLKLTTCRSNFESQLKLVNSINNFVYRSQFRLRVYSKNSFAKLDTHAFAQQKFITNLFWSQIKFRLFVYITQWYFVLFQTDCGLPVSSWVLTALQQPLLRLVYTQMQAKPNKAQNNPMTAADPMKIPRFLEKVRLPETKFVKARRTMIELLSVILSIYEDEESMNRHFASKISNFYIQNRSSPNFYLQICQET